MNEADNINSTYLFEQIIQNRESETIGPSLNKVANSNCQYSFFPMQYSSTNDINTLNSEVDNINAWILLSGYGKKFSTMNNTNDKRESIWLKPVNIFGFVNAAILEYVSDNRNVIYVGVAVYIMMNPS